VPRAQVLDETRWQVLAQGAAAGHVEHLQPPADGEGRDRPASAGPAEHGAVHREVELVLPVVGRLAARVRRLRVPGRVDVTAAGQAHAVEPGEPPGNLGDGRPVTAVHDDGFAAGPQHGVAHRLGGANAGQQQDIGAGRAASSNGDEGAHGCCTTPKELKLPVYC
jgi:hypothetical protein